MSIKYDYGIIILDVFKWITITALGFLIILNIIIFWNRKLKREINERIKTQEELKDSELRFKALSEAALEGIVISKNLIIINVNKRICEMLGYIKEDMIGTEITSYIKLSDKNKTRERIKKGFKEEYEIDIIKKSGELFTVEVKGRTMIQNGSKLRITSVRDISNEIFAKKEREKYIKDLQKIASTDYLTGLLNRKEFFIRADNEFERAKRYKNVFCLAILDIDDFKKVNDTYGHPSGDMVLKEFSDKISKNIRKNAIFGRLGREEFAILMPETNIEQAKKTMKKICDLIYRNSFDDNGKEIYISVSIGIASIVESEFDMSKLIKPADERLYSAKYSGKNKVIV